MSQSINDNFQLNAPKLLDQRSGKFVSGIFTAYTDKTEALTTINIAYRSEFLSVYIMVGGSAVEHWFYGGIADINLIPKGESCGYYLDPTTGQPWLTPSAANAVITTNSAGCKTKRITILSYNLIGVPQEYWYQDGTNLEAKLGNDASGADSTIFGDLRQYLPNIRSLVAGQSCFVGLRKDVSTSVSWIINTGVDPKTVTITLVGTTTAIVGKKIAIISPSGRFEAMVGDITVKSTSGGNDTLTINTELTWITTDVGQQVYNSGDTKVVIFEDVNTAVKRAMIAMGLSSVVFGDGAAAIGTGCYAEGIGAVALASSIAKGIYAVALNSAKALNDNSFAANRATVTGQYSAGFGLDSNLSGTNSFLAGVYLNVSGNDGTASFGRYNILSGDSALVSGRTGIFQHYASRGFATDEFGCYNFANGAVQLEEWLLKAETTSATLTNMNFKLKAPFPVNSNGHSLNEIILAQHLVTIDGLTVLVKEVAENEITAGNVTACPSLTARPLVNGFNYGVFEFPKFYCKTFNTMEILGGTHVGGSITKIEASLEYGSAAATSEAWGVTAEMVVTAAGNTLRFQVKGSPNKRLRWVVYTKGHEFMSGDIVYLGGC